MRSYAVRPERETCARVGTSAACMHVVEEEREYFAVCEYFRFDIWIKENGENEWGKKNVMYSPSTSVLSLTLKEHCFTRCMIAMELFR